MKRTQKSVPPYAGQEPYLHFCFSGASGKKALALLKRLYARGVRVWYPSGTAADRLSRDAEDARMLSASLTVLYLDEAFRNDAAAKSRLLTCQRSGQPILCINTDGGDSGLSIGLHADTAQVRLRRGDSVQAAEQALLHTEGFSQELIGEPQRVRGRGLRILTGAVIALSVLILLFGLWRFFVRPAAPEQTDTVVFSDAMLGEAVRGALGGGPLTEERLSELTVLRIPGDALPESLSDLSLLPALETVEISQKAAKTVSDYPELTHYTIALYGGASE